VTRELERTTCRVCSADQAPSVLFTILDLGVTPLADRLLESATDPEPVYPLRVGYCPTCHLVQLQDIVPDDLLFGEDYAFFTGASPSSLPYFAKYAEEVLSRFPLQCAGLVVEIAGNDGTLLQHFVGKSRQVVNVEPAHPAAAMSRDRGIPTITQRFCVQRAEELFAAYGWADLILANNVIAHVDDLHDVLVGINQLLAANGVFIFEVQYFPELLFNNAFDHVYHEHRSYFSMHALCAALDFHAFMIEDVQFADTQGGSIRVTCRKDELASSSPRTPAQSARECGRRSPQVAVFLAQEEALGLTRAETYFGLQDRADQIKEALVATLRDLARQGCRIQGFGASAKGNTLLNYCGIGPDLLECIVDLTPYKIGKYTPGMRIPVKSPADVSRPEYYLVLVWNYLNGILQREQQFFDQGGKLIVPIPTVRVI
jgi:SAM-dependent methyltransferase